MEGSKARFQATALLSRFNRLMLPHGRQWCELVAAGVAAHTVESLYPFEVGEYAPYIIRLLQEPMQRNMVATILGGRSQLIIAFSALPEAAYAEADAIVYRDPFFDEQPKLAGLTAQIYNRPDINGNATFLLRQWGYLLLFLRACFRYAALPEHCCASGECKAGEKCGADTTESDDFERWFRDIHEVAESLLAQITPVDSH